MGLGGGVDMIWIEARKRRMGRIFERHIFAAYFQQTNGKELW
jgi:hypothetical protein